MKLLALDTATEACSVALLLDDRLIVREAEFERGHAEHILPMVDAVLAEGGVKLTQLDAIAFGRGPGGFTGVRLAASVTQGLAFGASIPVVPVSDLAAVAQRALDLDPRVQRVLVCNDARMREVYWGCFERRGGVASAVGPERVSAPQSVSIPADWTGVNFDAAGRGLRVYPDLERSLAAVPVAIHRDWLPRAHEVARLAAPEVLAGRTVPAEQAIPVYLRDDVARPPS
jgi:tRNA threonylcarbamoyladenosine biosynthesis protein TsaB